MLAVTFVYRDPFDSKYTNTGCQLLTVFVVSIFYCDSFDSKYINTGYQLFPVLNE